jgi:hypothetical protein
VEEDLGREITLAVARMMVVFPWRPAGQSQFSAYVSLLETKNWQDIGELKAWIWGTRGRSQRTRLRGSHGHEPAQFFAPLSRRNRRDAGAVYRTGADRIGPLQTRTNRRTRSRPSPKECGFGNAERMRRTFQRFFEVGPHDYQARFRSTLFN